MGGQDLAALIRDAQAELNDAWSRGAGDGAEAAGKRATASRGAYRLERRAKRSRESPRCLEDVPVKSIEE
jgi:hypothetical protein